MSFQMSWLASISLDLASQSQTENKFLQNLLRLFLIYISFIFVFGFLGFPSLWAPFFGLLLSPLLELVLFPLAFLGCFLQPCSILFEFLFNSIIVFIENFTPEKNFLYYLDRNSVIAMNTLMIIFFLTLQMRRSKVKI